MDSVLLLMLFVPLAAAFILLAGRGLFSQSAARRFALQSLRLQATAAGQGAVQYRLARIDRKLGLTERSAPLF